MSQNELAALSARVQALEDRNAILDTLMQYGHALDYGDVERLMDCFTEDAVRETRRPDGTVNRWQGVAGTREFATTHTHAPDKYHKHLVLNSAVDLHGDTADVVSYMFRFDADEAADGGKSFVWGMGRYVDTMQRGPDGRWRIRLRVTFIEDDWPGRSRPATGLVTSPEAA
ncbi:nuclear transport factor 2 family protein [Variovorax sp. KK3]|uniref:nuclear transport factor 2 family protein n=1 Tax=Variovorax sp. KK3 TaxID=1855728 RepID=UPI00097BD1B5|nr:nuclear transport factor 2 family protein [Variovorax sp. KK3]